MSKISILKLQVGKIFFKQTPSRQSVISPKNKIVFLKKKKKVMINLKLYTGMHEIFLLGLN